MVVHDELDIPFGAIRLKLGGGDNGHNGLRSITAVARHQRLLPGPVRHRPPAGPDGRGHFVLRDFSAAERKELPLPIDRCADAVETLLSKGIAVAQNTFHAD